MPKEIEVKSVLNKFKKRDDWFLVDYSFNPYSGCSFNCLYCCVKGSKYGERIEKQSAVKINSVDVLDRQLANRAKKGQYGFIGFGSATDPYTHLDSEYNLTREALKSNPENTGFPVNISTKSDMIERDFDLLKEIEKNAILPEDLKCLKRGVIISFSFSTLLDSVAEIFEPGATPPSKRLIALEKSIANGFITGVNAMPLIPYISDTTEQLNLMFSTLKKKKADFILPSTITLFGNKESDCKVKTIKAIEKHYPELLPKYKKFFSYSWDMPEYYKNAFYKKMEELCEKYDLLCNIKTVALKKE